MPDDNTRDGDAERLDRIRWAWPRSESGEYIADSNEVFLLRVLAARDAALRDARAEIAAKDEVFAAAREALAPFAAFAEKAEGFVKARAEDGGSPILNSTDFRLADFKRADAALRLLARLDAAPHEDDE